MMREREMLTALLTRRGFVGLAGTGFSGDKVDSSVSTDTAGSDCKGVTAKAGNVQNSDDLAESVSNCLGDSQDDL